MSEDRARQRGNPMGITGATVANAVARYRVRAGLTQAQLSERLAAGGHPIKASAIGRIEGGDRRVEVDDLMAIAVALDVTPLALLLPWSDSASSWHRVTGSEVDWNAEHVWSWGVGEQPLSDEEDWESAMDEARSFLHRSLPAWLRVRTSVAKFDDEGPRGQR